MPDSKENQTENQEPTNEEHEEESEETETKQYEDRVHDMFTGVMDGGDEEDESE